MTLKHHLFYCTALFATLVFQPSGAAEVRYTVVPIEAPRPSPEPYQPSPAGLGINDLGQVVGAYSLFVLSPEYQQLERAFLYADRVGTLDLPWSDEFSLSAVGINNLGQIAVTAGIGGGESGLRAFRYTPGVGYESLGTLGAETEADAINALGQVSGFSVGPDGHSYAYRYTDGIGLEVVGPARSRGYAINDQGWVAGWAADHGAFLYRDDLGLIDLVWGQAYGINNAGMVVGTAWTGPVEGSEAFVYMDGQVVWVGNLGFQEALLGDINNRGEAVGIGMGGPVNALYWSEEDGLVNLNTLISENSGWSLSTAAAINDLGQITGFGSFNGRYLAYRLDPIPEPSVWMLLGLGGGFWLFCHRKRKG